MTPPPASTAGTPDRLFTPRFFAMCGFTFTVFLSAFQLLPTAPYRILQLGGNEFEAGLFLGFLTYASALSAPLTGALADRFGKRRMLIGCSFAVAVFSAAYTFIPQVKLMLGLVLVHGVFWSGLLSASSAYITDFIPPHRRAEGISYWGLSTILAVAVAPTVGFWAFARGWVWLCASATALNLLMMTIAWGLPADPRTQGPERRLTLGRLVEWRVLALSLTLFLYSFGYGGVTSFVALYADALHIAPVSLFADAVHIPPRGIFFLGFALTVLLTRPFSGRLSDRLGHRRIFLPCLVLIVAALGLLAATRTRADMIAAAVVFGVGFGNAYPAYAAHVITHVDPSRRGAAFGSILAAFDVGIGTGSVVAGWIIERRGFGTAFGTAALLATLALPFFLLAERRLLRQPIG